MRAGRLKKYSKTLGATALMLVGVGLMLSACSTQIAGLVLEDQTGTASVSDTQLKLVTTDQQTYELGEVDAAVKNALSLRPQAQQLTVLVHGMGRYPEKAFRHEEIQALSDTYSTAVVMLHWPSWESTVLPRQNALASGRLLSPLWKQLAQLRKQPLLTDKKLFLIAHSMGAEVLRGASQSAQTMVFDNLLLAAPETDLDGHAVWLSQLKLSPQKVVLVNQDDNILPFARSVMKKPRLGVTLDNGAAVEPLASDTRYLVLADITKWHSVYASRQPDGVKTLLRDLLLSGVVPQGCEADSTSMQLLLSPEGCKAMAAS